jgi:hypothetical protein
VQQAATAEVRSWARGSGGPVESRESSDRSEHDVVLELRVRVWFSGVAESCRGQSYAQVVEVMQSCRPPSSEARSDLMKD